MPNLSQIKRQRLLEFLNKIREEHSDDASLIAVNEIETELTNKKYGLIWEEHEERVDIEMLTKVPVFSEVQDREITCNKDMPYNFLLEGDNLHSLKLLEKTHKGKIDVIYIDPPYNTGNKDFVYDDEFVEALDGFRHSKWLSFISERLRIARNLLKEKGVLVISIGYHEVNNLMILCQELFDNRQVTCVTLQTSGGKPNGGFNVVQEYLVFVTPVDFSANPSEDAMNTYSSPYHGMTLASFNQVQRPNQAYPIFIDCNGGIVGCGKSLQDKINDGEYEGDLAEYKFDYHIAPEGTVAVWPVSKKGEPCVWRLISSSLMNNWRKGYVKVIPQNSSKNDNKYTVQFLSQGIIEKIESGELETYRISDRHPTLDVKEYKTAGTDISTMWTNKKYYTTKGSNEIRDILGRKDFSYPKPKELIYDVLERVSKRNDLILDFFAGSGTTGQAVIELNKNDGRCRRFILCTNNENNICENVTYERMKRIINGYSFSGKKERILYEKKLTLKDLYNVADYLDEAESIIQTNKTDLCKCKTSYKEGVLSVVSTEQIESMVAGIPANLKYYRTDFVSKNADNIGLELLDYISEMVQLEHAVKLDGLNYILLLSDDEADSFFVDNDKLNNCKGLYVSSSVLLTARQERQLASTDISVCTIPDYYFESELLEVGER
jgi:adenine-specific DNA-methyltransferase